jgi:chromosome segregation ATPase
MTAALLRRPGNMATVATLSDLPALVDEAKRLRAEIQRRTAVDNSAVLGASGELDALQKQMRTASALARFRLEAEIQRARQRLESAFQQRARTGAHVEVMHERLRVLDKQLGASPAPITTRKGNPS